MTLQQNRVEASLSTLMAMLKRHDRRQRWAEASPSVPTATLKCRNRCRSPTAMLKHCDWRQWWAEASPSVPTATLKRRDWRWSPTTMHKHRDRHRSTMTTLKRRNQRRSPTTMLKRCDRCGLELLASPLSLIGDGVSFIDNGWAQRWRWVSLFFFFFLTEMATEMFCGSWFLFGVLGIEIPVSFYGSWFLFCGL